MAREAWRTMLFDEAVLLNPPVALQRGEVYPFVDMQALDPSSRAAGPSEHRTFNGGGSRFAAGDTLMARITPCLENGKIARFQAEAGNSVGHGSTEFIVIRGREGVTDNDFAYYLTRWDGVRGYAISQMTGSSGRQRVPTAALSHLEVSVPPLPEQRAIAGVLGALDDKIELNRRMCRTLEGIARAIFQAWFVDFLPVRAKAAGARSFRGMPQAVFDTLPTQFTPAQAGASPLGPIPKGWRVVCAGDVAEVNAWTLGRSDDLDYIDYIEISQVMRGEIGQIVRYERGNEPSRARRRLRHGDTVLSTVRPDRGACFLCLNPPETLIASTGFAVLSPRDGMWAFLYSAMTRPDVSDELGRLADGGAYPAVRPEVVAAREFVVPGDTAITRAFEAVAESLFEKAWHCRQQSKTLAAVRDALLPKLVSGELRIRDVERIIGRCA